MRHLGHNSRTNVRSRPCATNLAVSNRVHAPAPGSSDGRRRSHGDRFLALPDDAEGRESDRMDSRPRGAAPAHWKPSNDAKIVLRAVLREQCERVHSQRRRRNPPLEFRRQLRHDRVGVGDCAGQREMHAEFVEHIGIAPGVEIIALARRKPFGRATPDLGRGQRRAQRIEFANDLGFEPSQLARWLLRPQRDEGAPLPGGEPADAQRTGVEGFNLSSEVRDARFEIAKAPGGIQRERGFERGMEAITARLGDERAPGLRVISFGNEALDALARVGVAAENAQAKSPEIAVGRGREIDGEAGRSGHAEILARQDRTYWQRRVTV